MQHRVDRARLGFDLERVSRVAASRVKPQVGRQKERPEHLILTRVVALVDQQPRSDRGRAHDHSPKRNRAEPTPRQEQVRQAAVRFGDEQTMAGARSSKR